MSQNRLTTARLIAAYLLSVLACAGLGAFSGCDLGMVEAARGASQHVFTMIVVGGSIGVLVGLAASFWDKSWARQISQVQRTREALCASYGIESYADWQPPSSVSYILCWIPPQFVAMVEMGIQVNLVECFFWASEYKRRHYDTKLLRGFDGMGLLG